MRTTGSEPISRKAAYAKAAAAKGRKESKDAKAVVRNLCFFA